MKEILINQLFAGAYLQEGTNIGHEVINLFCDDKGQHYIFVTPSGVVSNHDVESIVFVQNIKAKETMEVIMKAEGLTPVTSDEIQHISYAGISIKNIFNKNIYHGEADTAQLDIYATYKAEVVKLPKPNHRILLTVDPSYKEEDAMTQVVLIDPEKSRIVGQGMRTYLSGTRHTIAYDNVKKMLDDNSLWDDGNTLQKLIPDGTNKRSSFSFLEIIRKENDEIIFSNLLAYYFDYNHSMFVRFADEILGIPDMSIRYNIIRESMNNIDLWIEDESQVLVIENKIKSGLNGKTDRGETQLTKYYNCGQKYKRDHDNIKKVHYFIFLPNYNRIDSSDFPMKEFYKIISYKDIYSFYKRHASEFIDDKYFPDFLNGLKNQTMSLSELRFSIMRSRFLEKTNQR